jgi:hypothetical protein
LLLRFPLLLRLLLRQLRLLLQRRPLHNRASLSQALHQYLLAVVQLTTRAKLNVAR